VGKKSPPIVVSRSPLPGVDLEVTAGSQRGHSGVTDTTTEVGAHAEEREGQTLRDGATQTPNRFPHQALSAWSSQDECKAGIDLGYWCIPYALVTVVSYALAVTES